MTTPTISDYLKYANLQMAAEAFLIKANGTLETGTDLVAALVRGNDHNSKFTQLQAEAFASSPVNVS